jgi:hypothetical protein
MNTEEQGQWQRRNRERMQLTGGVVVGAILLTIFIASNTDQGSAPTQPTTTQVTQAVGTGGAAPAPSAGATGNAAAPAPSATPPPTTQTLTPPSTVKDLTITVAPGPDGDIVTAKFKVSDNFTKGLIKDGARINTVDILKYVQAAYPNLAEVDVIAVADMVDVYGRTSVDQVATLTYSRATLDKIDWNNFDFKNIWNVPIAFPVWVHRDLQY